MPSLKEYKYRNVIIIQYEFFNLNWISLSTYYLKLLTKTWSIITISRYTLIKGISVEILLDNLKPVALADHIRQPLYVLICAADFKKKAIW